MVADVIYLLAILSYIMSSAKNFMNCLEVSRLTALRVLSVLSILRLKSLINAGLGGSGYDENGQLLFGRAKFVAPII